MRHLRLLLVPVAVMACGEGATSPDVAQDNTMTAAIADREPVALHGVPDRLIYGLLDANVLVSFRTSEPGALLGTVRITGLRRTDETLLGVDFRPSDNNPADGVNNTGKLYGYSSAGTIYIIDPATGTATFSSQTTTLPMGDATGVGFNPVPDRLRVHTGSGQNLRLNVDNGVTLVDGALRYADSDVAAGTAPRIAATAYTNSDNDPATGTELYAIDAATSTLVELAAPNDGILTTVGALGVEIGSAAGFDIVGTGDRTAYATLTPKTGNGSTASRSDARAFLFAIDLESGRATRLGRVGNARNGAPLSIAVAP